MKKFPSQLTSGFFIIFILCSIITGQAFAGPTWTGFYCGAFVGYTHTRAEVDGGLTQDGTYWTSQDQEQLPPILSKGITGDVLTGSIFGGGDYQIGPWVIGLQARLMVGGMDDDNRVGPSTYISSPSADFTTATRMESNHMVGIIPRIGYARDRSLFYGFGGLVASRFTYSFEYSDTYSHPGGPAAGNFKRKKSKLGWTAGLGYEYQMDDGWGLMAEYSHYEFNNLFDTTYTVQENEPTSGFYNAADKFRADTVHIGIIKRF